MTDKELHKLNRHKLLELLLSQSKDVSQQRYQIEELSGSLDEAQDMIERLKSKLDGKDEQLDRLKGRLNDKDAAISALESQVASRHEAHGSALPAQQSAPAREKDIPAARNIGFSIESASEREQDAPKAPGTPDYTAPTASAAAAYAAEIPNVIPFPVLRPNAVPGQESDAASEGAAVEGISVDEFVEISRAILTQYLEMKQGLTVSEEIPAKAEKLKKQKKLAKPKKPSLRERFAKFRAETADTMKVWNEACAESWDEFWTSLKNFRWRDTDLYASLRKKAADYFELKQ